MDREKFVGVVFSMAMDGKKPVDYFLKSFVGEGNTAIVYGIAPLRNPKAKKWVLKFYKPDARFEMSVLHYSFRIAEKLYPNHPLLMTADERMRRLTDEMLDRIQSDGSLFRLDAFRDMLMVTIEILANQFQERFRAGTLPPDWLNEVDSSIAPMIDDGLVLEIESLLDDDQFLEEARSFFENSLEDIHKAIANAKQEGVFHPLSRNRLFKLLGLQLENFIDWKELMTITDSERFRPALLPDEVADFAAAVSILYFRASAKKEDLEKSSEEDRSRISSEYQEILAAALAAPKYMDAVAAKYHSGLPHFSAFAKNWHARTLLLEDKQTEAISLFEEVLQLPVIDDSQPERHDALMDLANLVADSAPKRAKAYAREAQGIRRALKKASESADRKTE